MPYISCCSKHYVAYTPHTRALRADWVWPVGKHDDHAIESIEVSLQCASRKYKERWWYVFNRKIEMNKNKQESKKRCGCFIVEVFFFFLFCFVLVCLPSCPESEPKPSAVSALAKFASFWTLESCRHQKARPHNSPTRPEHTHNTNTITTQVMGFFFFFFFCCCRFLFGGFSFFKQQDRYLSVWHPVVNGCLHGTNNWMTRDQTQKEKKKKDTHARHQHTLRNGNHAHKISSVKRDRR